MQILIDARIRPNGHVGGIEQFIQGMVWGLGHLLDGDEEYTIAVEHSGSWLEQYIGRSQRIIVAPAQHRDALKGILGPLRRPLGDLRSAIFPGSRARVPVSGGFYESQGSSVVHFAYQSFVRSRVASIYNPHDLLHLHFPEFFSRAERARRDAVYRSGCLESKAVAAESQWARADIVDRIDVAPENVYSIPLGSVMELLPDPTEQYVKRVQQRFQLPEMFALYPAQTWPHKNHLRLLEAVAECRDRGVDINLICTGSKNAFWSQIERKMQELNLSGLVHFLGYVDAIDLRALYRLAAFMVFPSLMEGGGLPVVESMAEGTPVACSRSSALVEYAGDAAMIFDPTSTDEIAGALEKLMADPALRESLRARGRHRARRFRWQECARAYRALYRLVGGEGLSDEDSLLLRAAQGEENWDPDGSVPE